MKDGKARWKSICRDLCALTDELRDQWLIQQTGEERDFFAGITAGQRRMLRIVWRLTRNEPEGIMLRVLAARLGLSSSAVSVMVDSLVRRGILERIPVAADRRKVLIRLGEKGELEFYSSETFFGEVSECFFSGYPEEKVACLEGMLKDFNKYLTNINQEKKK